MPDKTIPPYCEAKKCEGSVFRADDRANWDCSLPLGHDGDCDYSVEVER